MNLSEYMISLNEGFGDIKINRPTTAGLNAAKAAADQFTKSSDGKDTDVDMYLDDAFNDDGSGFEDANHKEIPAEQPEVDMHTVPAVPEEEDQFEDVIDSEEDEPAEHMSDAELAEDDDADTIDESFNGWDDLF